MSSFELMGPHRLRGAGPAELSALLGAGEGAGWAADDLGAILRHQLAAPLRDDLVPLKPEAAAELVRLEEGLVHPPATFADLLAHPAPPPALLARVKQFAKAQREADDPALPGEVATVLYYAALAAALARHGRRISTMDDAALLAGFDWGAARLWVEGRTRGLLQEAQAALNTAPPRRGPS